MLQGAFIACALWLGTAAVPWNYPEPRYTSWDVEQGYDEPGSPKQPDYSLGARDEDRWRRPTRSRHYASMPSRNIYNRELEERKRWNAMDDYNRIDDGYDWDDMKRAADEGRAPGYDMDKVYDTLGKWRQEELEREMEERYWKEAANNYVKTDKRSWQRTPLDSRLLQSMIGGYDDTDEEVPPKGGMDVLQRIGMTLTDLGDSAPPDTTTNDADAADDDADDDADDAADDAEDAAADDDDDDSDSDISDDTADDDKASNDGQGKAEEVEPVPSMTVKKAKSLLKQLEAVEQKRGSKEKVKETKKPLSKSELEAILDTKEANSEKTKRGENEADDSDEDEDKRTGDAEMRTAVSKPDAVGNTLEGLRKTKLELVREENALLIEALQYAPIELMQSRRRIGLMKTLIGKAALRQDAVDYIDEQVGEK